MGTYSRIFAINILTDQLPKTVDVCGQIYKINSDFRTCLKVILAFEDNELTPQEKQLVLLSNLYPVLPDDLQGALQAASLFLNCGKPDTEEETHPRVYSFSKDAEMIFSAFRQIHQIDLESVDLHWWAFISLFMSVLSSQSNPFGSLVSLRLRVKTGKATREELQAYRSLGDFADVPEIEDLTLEEREAQARFMELVNQGNMQ